MEAKAHPYLTTLTPLRGIAALFIVIFHGSIQRPFLPPGYTSFLDNCRLWVDFFFVLSGFIMCYAYGKYFVGGVNKTTYKKYIGARFARIYPLYFITTIWAFVCAIIIVRLTTNMPPLLIPILNPKALPACLLLIQSLHLYSNAPLNSPAWSLSTEWWVYVIFPFLVPLFLTLKVSGKIVTTALIIVFYIFLRYLIGPLSHLGPSLDIITDYGLLRCLAGFCAGMLLFTFYEQRLAYSIIKSDWFFLLSFAGALAAMHFGVIDIIIVGVFPFILLSAAYNQTRVKIFLDTRPLQRLGDWSFSIYMVHMPIKFTILTLLVIGNHDLLDVNRKEKAPDYIGSAQQTLILVILTLVIAPLFYRFVEITARNYLNKVFKTKHKEITSATLEV